MSDRARAMGLHSGAAPIVARGEITDHHLHFARTKRREGVGWQAIAHMLGVNRDTLQSKAGSVGLAAVARPAPPVAVAVVVEAKASAPRGRPPKPAKPCKPRDRREGLRPGGQLHRVLAAIGAGEVCRHTALAEVTGLNPPLVGAALTMLRRKGLVSSAGRGADNLMTEAGAAELARLAALAEGQGRG